MSTRLLLLEDDPAIARTVAYALERDGLQVTHCLLVQDARQQMQRQPFDLLVLDVGLPDGCGLDRPRDGRHGQALPLTRRESRLLSHLLRGAGRIHSLDALLAAAWGDDSESTDRTVDTHIKTLRAKLREVDPAREYISTHRGMGYCLDVQ